MPSPTPVDISSFTPTQQTAFNAANALGSGVPIKPAQTITSPTANPQNNPTNAGKPGYDVFGAPVQTQPNTNTTPPQGVTSFSSDTAQNNYIPQNQQKMQTLSQTGLTVGPDNLARYSDSSFATAPSDAVQNQDGTWASGGVNYAIGPATTQDPELKAMTDQINQMKTQFDSSSQASINNIQQQFQQLITQQQDVNTRGQASLNQSLLMSGSSRYSQESSTGQTTALMSYGLQQIADLNTKEQSAVIQAQQAQEAGDMKLMDDSLTIAQKARDDKQAAAKTLSDKLTAANDALQQQKKQQAQDSAIADLYGSGTTDPTKIMDALKAQGITANLHDISATLSDLQKPPDPMTASALSWAQEAAKNGADPATIQKAIALAKTDPTGALSLLSGSLSDPLKAQMDKLDMEQKQASIANTKMSTAKTAQDMKIAADNNAPVADIAPGTPQYKVAQDLAYGNLTMQQFRTLYSYSRNINQKLGIYQLASQMNPNFSPAAFELGYTFASNPKVRQQVTSLDNVTNMFPNIIAASDAATRTGTGLNGEIIKGGVMLGNTSYSNMQLARTAFADELSGALGYGSATDMSREMGFDLTNPNLSAQQFSDGMKQIVQPFIQNKRSTLVNAMGQYGNTINSMSSGQAGQGAGGVKFKDPTTGEVRTFTNLAPADFQDAIKQGFTVVQ